MFSFTSFYYLLLFYFFEVAWWFRWPFSVLLSQTDRCKGTKFIYQELRFPVAFFWYILIAYDDLMCAWLSLQSFDFFQGVHFVQLWQTKLLVGFCYVFWGVGLDKCSNQDMLFETMKFLCWKASKIQHGIWLLHSVSEMRYCTVSEIRYCSLWDEVLFIFWDEVLYSNFSDVFCYDNSSFYMRIVFKEFIGETVS